MLREDIRKTLNDPVAQELLKSKILARVAYSGLDGLPRVIPIWFHWNGKQFIIGSLPASPKVKALKKNPKVALTIDENSFPPRVLLVRGTAITEVIAGVVSEYADAARRYLGEEQGQGWVEQARGLYKQMARIAIEPEWVKVLDFQTRFPKAVEEAMGAAGHRST